MNVQTNVDDKKFLQIAETTFSQAVTILTNNYF
jgi:hypothetical protein